MLKGLGAVAIGLPLLEEMLVSTAAAATPKAVVPVRAFNVFFGLGIPSPLQKEGFDGVMEPLKDLREKLLIMRNVDHVRTDVAGDNAHRDGATAAFTAEPPQGTAKAGGPSIDQVIRASHYPNGLPPQMVPTLVAGTFFRRDRVSRYAKSFSEDGTVAATTQEQPRELFERIFGSAPDAGDASDPSRERQKRSVLRFGGRAIPVLHGRELTAWRGVEEPSRRAPRPHPRIRAARFCDERQEPPDARSAASFEAAARRLGRPRRRRNRHHTPRTYSRMGGSWPICMRWRSSATGCASARSLLSRRRAHPLEG